MNTPLTTTATLILTAPLLFAQDSTKSAASPDPVALVAEAEKSVKAGDKEEAVMLLWEAVDALRSRPDDLVRQATSKAAAKLLGEHDPLDEARQSTFREVADKVVGIAKNYRIKKWYRTAAWWLEVADDFDPAAGKAEHRRLDAKRKSADKPTKPAKAKPKEPSLLAASNMLFQSGAIQNKGDVLYAPATNGESFLMEWVTKSRHEDNEVTIDYRALDPKASYSVALAVGQRIRPGHNNYSGIRATVVYENGRYGLWIWEVRGMEVKQIGQSGGGTIKPKDEPHRITARVKGNELTFQLDQLAPIKATSDEPIHGTCGVVLSHPDIANSAIELSNLRIGPLPEDQPSTSELAEQENTRRQNQVSATLEDAKKLIAARKHEDAAEKLRAALALTVELGEGILRETFEESIDELLTSTDKLRKKTDAAATACAETIGVLADKYVAAGQPRLAKMLMPRATWFDRAGQQERLAVIERKITDWNAEQAKKLADQLLPPNDDGSLLRQWFQGGKLLLPTKNLWTIAGAEARAQKLVNEVSYWMPSNKTMPAGTFGVHVSIPTIGGQAGLCFDVAGPHAMTSAVLSRNKSGLTLVVNRWASGKWIQLGTRRIKMDPWRLEGWHAITVKTQPAGVRIKACGQEIVLQRRDLANPTPLIGLAAGNYTKKPVDVAIRAFHAKPE